MRFRCDWRRRWHAAAAVVAAAAATVAMNVAEAATLCPGVEHYSISCEKTHGLLKVSPFLPGHGIASTCRGYCISAPVTVRPQPCVFCSTERCEKGVDLQGDPVICCDETAGSAACGAPDKGCRYFERGKA